MHEPPDTRTRLLDAAIAVIESEGEAAVRVRDISAAAGVTYPSLYHFFGSRDGLIESAQAERYLRDLEWDIQAFGESVAACRTRVQFRNLVRDGLASTYLPERVAVRATRAEVLGSAQSRPGLAACVAEANARFAKTFSAVLEMPRRKGWIRGDVDLEVFALWLTGLFNARTLIELDPDRYDATAWQEITLTAVTATLGL